MNTDELKALLAQGELRKVADGLVDRCRETSAEKDALLLSGRLAKTEKEWQLGTLSREHYQLEINNLGQAMLQLADRLPAAEDTPPVRKRRPAWSWGILLLAAAGAALLIWRLWPSSGPGASIVEGEKIPEQLHRELLRLQQAGERIKYVSINPDLSWVVLYGLNRSTWQDVPSGLQFALDSFSRTGAEIRQVVLGPHSEWLMVLNYNGYWQDRMPAALTQHLDSLHAQRREIRQVAMGAGYEWLVLHDNNGYASERLPKAAFDTIVSFNRRHKEIHRVAWGGEPAAWVVLGDGEVSFSENADTRLKASVNAAIEHHQNIRSILILPDSGWLVVKDEK